MKTFVVCFVFLVLVVMETTSLPAGASGEVIKRLPGSVGVVKCCNERCACWQCPDTTTCNLTECTCNYGGKAEVAPANQQIHYFQNVEPLERMVLDKLDHMGDNEVLKVVQEKMTVIRKADTIDSEEGAEGVEESMMCRSDACGTWLCPHGNTCGACHCVPPQGDSAAATYQAVMEVTSYKCCGGRCGCFTCSGTAYQCNLVKCTCHIP